MKYPKIWVLYKKTILLRISTFLITFIYSSSYMPIGDTNGSCRVILTGCLSKEQQENNRLQKLCDNFVCY